MTDSYARHRQRANESRKRRNINERQLVLAHYGTACVCCDATEGTAVFPVDNTPKHVVLGNHGMGWSPTGFNHLLVSLNFPEGYETRCMRCHRFMRGGNGCVCGGKRTPPSEDPEG